MQAASLSGTLGHVARAALALTILLSTADAAVLTVDTTADDVAPNANCTLREAVIAANSDLAVDSCPAGDPGLDTIRLSAATYT